MKKLACSLLVLSVLAGCATVQPQQVVTQLDTRAEKYDTADCRSAREVALAYEDNRGIRFGVGVGLGLFLGPFGIPVAIAVDMHQKKKRDAVLTELTRHCGEVLPGDMQQTAPTALPVAGPASPPRRISNPGSPGCSHGVPGAC
jgi:hypothetical protein